MTRALWVAVAWAALLGLVAALAPAFFDPVNLRDLIVRASPLLIVASGMTVVILARQIDISVGSQFAIRTPSIEAPVGTLSGGNQQKVALARWLATKPRLLILDEPTQGVDIGAKAEIHRLIRALAADGLAILLISSELTELLGLAHRIGVMRGGRLVGLLDHAEATEERLMSLALGHTPLALGAEQPGGTAQPGGARPA